MPTSHLQFRSPGRDDGSTRESAPPRNLLVTMACVLLALAAAPIGCHSAERGTAGRMRERAPATEFPAEGVLVRHLRLRLAPSHTRRFEAVLEECAAAARSARLDETHAWMAYREPPGRYWIVQLADDGGSFALPDDLRGFVSAILEKAEAAGETTRNPREEAEAELAKLEIEVEWNLLLQTKSGWGTVDAMSTATHPKARLIDRTIRPGMEAEFDRALSARTAFFARRDYPLPVEGFVVRAGAPGRAIQVVFPVDWPSFHAATSFFEFSKTLDEEGQREYAERKADLLETMSRAEYYDGSFVPEISFGGM